MEHGKETFILHGEFFVKDMFAFWREVATSFALKYMGYHIDSLDMCFGTQLADSRGDIGVLMTHKYKGSIVVLSVSKSVEPNEEQKEMTSGFQ